MKKKFSFITVYHNGIQGNTVSALHQRIRLSSIDLNTQKASHSARKSCDAGRQTPKRVTALCLARRLGKDLQSAEVRNPTLTTVCSHISNKASDKCTIIISNIESQ